MTQFLTVPDSMRVERVRVLGGTPSDVHLWRVSPFNVEHLGSHRAGESFASPPAVYAGEVVVVQCAAGSVALEPLRDAEWLERQEQERAKRRAEAQENDADLAIWWAGCPT